MGAPDDDSGGQKHSDFGVRRGVRRSSLRWLRGEGFNGFLICVVAVIAFTFLFTGFTYLSPNFGHTPSVEACRNFRSGCPDFRRTSSLLCWLVVLCCILTIGELFEKRESSPKYKRLARMLTLNGWFSRLDDGPRSLCFVLAGLFTAFALASVIRSSADGGLSTLPWWDVWAPVLCWIIPVVLVLAVVANWAIIVRRGFSSEFTFFFIVAVLFTGVSWAGWTLSGLAEASAIVAIATGLARWMRLRPMEKESNT